MISAWSFIRDNAAAIGVVIAIVSSLASMYFTFRQLNFSVLLVRYDAVRSKRATAKALREEIIEITADVTSASREPAVFNAMVSSLGRLDEASISSVIKFYGALNRRPHADEKELLLLGKKAVADLDGFVKSSRKQRDTLKKKLRVNE